MALSIITQLKSFGLTDDQILEIATERRMLDAIGLLRGYLSGKWVLSIQQGFTIIKQLREELN